MSNIYWFNLPSEIVGRIRPIIGGSQDIQDLLDDLTWFKLPEKLQALIDVINLEIDTPYSVSGNINWFNVRTQAEAFVLDLESRQRYGPELIVNGGFDSDSDWTDNPPGTSSWTISGGTASSIGGPSHSIFQYILEESTLYRMEFTVSNYTSGQVKIRTGGGGEQGSYKSATGTYVEFLTSGTGTPPLIAQIVNFSVTGFTGSIDNVSVRELDGNGTVIPQ